MSCAIDLMRHAIGIVPGHIRTTRNHFCATPDSDHDSAWTALVDQGLAVRSPVVISHYHVYAVTDAGKAMVSP